MRVTSTTSEPIYRFQAASVVRGGGGFEMVDIPLLNAVAEDLPAELDAILVAGDLQGVADPHVSQDCRQLSGTVIASELAEFAELGLLHKAERTGVILTGDFFTDLSLRKRGGTGDVQEVWSAFSRRFRWVVGVAGNHDLFHGRSDCTLPTGIPNAELLDGGSCERDGLLLAGVCGVVGTNGKPWRRTPERMSHAVREALRSRPDIFVSHEPPKGPNGEPGDDGIRAALAQRGRRLLICSGHVGWDDWYTEDDVHQYLNAEGRLLYLTRSAVSPL